MNEGITPQLMPYAKICAWMDSQKKCMDEIYTIIFQLMEKDGSLDKRAIEILKKQIRGD